MLDETACKQTYKDKNMRLSIKLSEEEKTILRNKVQNSPFKTMTSYVLYHCVYKD